MKMEERVTYEFDCVLNTEKDEEGEEQPIAEGGYKNE